MRNTPTSRSRTLRLPLSSASVIKMAILKTYDECYKKIGGEQNEDIHWYLNSRPKIITRKTFFREAVFAVWVSGMSRKSTSTFLEKAVSNGFSWDFSEISILSVKKWDNFVIKLHGHPSPNKAKAKWAAIKSISSILNDLESERHFRKSWFQGKYKSHCLNQEDVTAIRLMKLPYIGPANSQFIIRNIGGEAIKCDRWIMKFLSYFKITHSELLVILKAGDVPEGQFDLVIWVYCEMFIKDTKHFNEHFSKTFASIP